jgi:cobalt-zinc-cadmium efflux system membrane fusion protein
MDQAAAKRMGVKTAIAHPAHLVDALRLAGTLTLDAGNLQEVRSRFAGEVVEISKTRDGTRPILFGDRVAKDQLLAVVWSRDLGEKKSELVEIMSQLNLHRQTLARLKQLYENGEIPERQYRDAEHDVQENQVAIARVRRTLQTWRVPQEEIAAVEAEAERLLAGKEKLSEELTQQWARVEVRAALDGVVLERNVAVGDMISTDEDLFKVADLARLRVLAFAYEEDLPKLDALAPARRKWTISLPADPTLPHQEGTVDRIGDIIDPTQHTALVMGWVDNPQGRLRAGQFIMATVELPPPGNEVALPASALIEKGGQSLVFVQTAAEPKFTQRCVSVSRQVGQTVCIRIQPPTGGAFPVQPLRPGEVVVVSGAVELQQALTDLTAVASENRGIP